LLHQFAIKVVNGATAAGGGTDPATSALMPDATFGGYVTGTNVDKTSVLIPDDNMILIDFSKVTQFGKQVSNVTSVSKNGNAPGSLERLNIGTDGKITGGYSNGMTKLLGQIVVANFANAAGLEKVGNNMYVTTPNSGEFDGIGVEVQASGGNIRSGVLEMSNVDLSSEFTELITTQRGFQANSRIITTSDDMLAELVNLKR